MDKIIFLDIDGVLSNINTKNLVAMGGSPFLGLDPNLLQIFLDLIARVDAKIVLSTSWRDSKDLLAELKNNGINFVGKTPRFGTQPERGLEIKDYLDKHQEIKRYAIIDDNDWMLPEQKENFFKTSALYGLTQEIADSITQHFA